jgi:hypothetical protein
MRRGRASGGCQRAVAGVALLAALVTSCARLPGPPGPPAEVASEGGPGYVRVVWDAPDGAASGFEVLREGAGAETVAGAVGADRRSFVDEGAEAGVSYRYAVRSLGELGEPGASRSAADSAVSARAAGARPGDNPDADRFLAVVVLDHLGNGVPDADVVAAVQPPGRSVELLQAVTGDDGVALLADAEDQPELAGAVGGFVWIAPPRGAGVAPVARFVGGLTVPGTWVADPDAPELVDLVVDARQGGETGNFLLQLVGQVGDALVVGGVVDVSRPPTVLRVDRGAADAVVTGYANAPGIGAHVWTRVTGDAPMRLAVDPAQMGAVPFTARYALGGPGAVVSAFLCPSAQRPGVAVLRSVCVGDATVLLTPQLYGLGAVVRARTGDVDWIYTYAMPPHVPDAATVGPVIGEGVALTARAQPLGDGTWAIRAEVADAAGNTVTSAIRREGGTSVPLAVRAELRDEEGFLVDVRWSTLEEIADWAYAPPADAHAGRYTLTLRLAAGPVAARTLRTAVDLTVGNP